MIALGPQKICDWENDSRISFDKSAVEVCEAEEDADVVNRLWSGPFVNGGDALRVHRYSVGRNDVTEEGQLLNGELAFR